MGAAVKVFKDDRKREYLNAEGADKPMKSPVPASVLRAARSYRFARLHEQMAKADCDGMLLYDPVNIRYAFDITNMQVWTAHNAVRYALILRDGPAIMFEFRGAFHLCDDNPAIDEVRPAIAWIYLSAGDLGKKRVEVWADEITDILHTHCGPKSRLAIDKVEPMGVWALERRGVVLLEGQELTERARSIKSADELQLMRWTIRVCEAGMARIYENSVPGRTEQELWAELHFENARSGGEWLETRLLTCGAHTNPWYSECSDRICLEGEMIAFDTDMIGPYGYCADLSRSWTCGHTTLSPKQYEIYMAAVEQIEHNLGLIKAGVSFDQFNERSWRIPEKYQPYRYTLAAHAVGLADEWPVIPLHPDFDRAYPGMFEENMVICVESLIAEAGSESVKLETQVLVTAKGVERLDSFPWETV